MCWLICVTLRLSYLKPEVNSKKINYIVGTGRPDEAKQPLPCEAFDLFPWNVKYASQLMNVLI